VPVAFGPFSRTANVSKIISVCHHVKRGGQPASSHLLL
jgi:hypothetical protein